MQTCIALLRGINVGGNKKIRMAELKELCEGLGLRDVQTLLQSGNVVFRSGEAVPEALAARLEAAIQARFGFEVRVILRTLAQWRAILAGHPFSEAQIAEPSKILLACLSAAPSEQAWAALLAGHSGPEIVQRSGAELYIFYTEGMGRSKLDNSVLERRLKVISTGRNWNTVHKLLTLAEEIAQRA